MISSRERYGAFRLRTAVVRTHLSQAARADFTLRLLWRIGVGFSSESSSSRNLGLAWPCSEGWQGESCCPEWAVVLGLVFCACMGAQES